MQQRVHIDIETYSSVDLKAYGVYRYASSPDFLILMCAWSLDGVLQETKLDHNSSLELLLALQSLGTEFCAHNANFERVCFTMALRRAELIEPEEWLDPADWHDTRAVAGELGYPQSLDGVARALGATPKDEAGADLIRWFCKPISAGKLKGQRRLPEDHPVKWMDFIAYCEQDVETLVEVDNLLEKQGGWPTPMEHQVFLADQRINDRGIAIDIPMARRAYQVAQINQEAQKQRVRELARIDNPGSVPQMMKWAERERLDMDNMRAETVTSVLQRQVLKPHVREVLELRQELALAAPAKFATALGAQIDGRLHGTLQFFGAHTGRWAGRGTQVQNLPRASFKHDVDQVMAIEDLMRGDVISSEELKQLVRPMFIGPFTVVDYSAIEAVVIAWLAGEEWALQAFRDGRDIYVETATRMGGLSRPQGKIAVLALGYNGGPNSLRAMAGDRDVVRINPKTGQVIREGTLLTAQEEKNAVTSRIIDMGDEQLYEEFVNPWRQANSRIVRLWKLLDARFRTGGPVGEHLSFEKANGGRDRLLRLPSGRFIAYRGVGLKRDLEGRERLTFAAPYGFRADTYGGRLAENATQAVARDLLAEALVRLERAGKHVVAHVHDEVLVEGSHPVEEIRAIVCKLPRWAKGMPVNGSGWTGYRYKKD